MDYGAFNVQTNDEKNTNERFRHLVSSSCKRRKTDNNKKKKKEAEKRTDEKEANELDPGVIKYGRQKGRFHGICTLSTVNVLNN